MSDATFTPGEVGSLIGVSPALQRDWRRRGLLPSREGARNRYTQAEVLRMFVIKEIGKAGCEVEAALYDIPAPNGSMPAILISHTPWCPATLHETRETLVDAIERTSACTVIFAGRILSACGRMEALRGASC